MRMLCSVRAILPSLAEPAIRSGGNPVFRHSRAAPAGLRGDDGISGDDGIEVASRANAEEGSQALAVLQRVPEDLDSTICPESAKTPLIRGVLQQVEAEFEELTWKAFWMAAIDGAKAADIATTLGISVASVYQSKSRVLLRLRMRLSELPE